MFALYDDQRQLLIRVGIMLAVGAAAVLPFTIAPTSLDASAEILRAAPPISSPTVTGRMEFPMISVNRDPFVPDAGIIGRDLPQIGAAAATQPVLRAVVSGEQPRALVEVDGSVRVLAIGDKIGADVISAIDAAGVTLSSGVRLVLAPPQ
jgi:hypothetical protein